MTSVAVPASGSIDSIQIVRHFNRFYTRQIGVLQEHLMKSPFSLTEVRVLYELAHREHVTAGELCQDLDLDRGYISRMLQGFEKQGWIKTTPSAEDRRRIFLSLTSKGRKIFDPLDSRSSEEVSTMLSKLSSPQQKKLLGAMHEIESVLSPAPQPVVPFILRQHKPGEMGWVVQRHGELYYREYGYATRLEAIDAQCACEI